MNGILPDLIKSFEECLKMVGGQSDHHDVDAALAMTFILMQRKVFNEQERSILSMKLSEKCLKRGSIFHDVKEQVEFLEIASFYPETVKYLVNNGVFNLSTLRLALDKLNHEVRKSRGYSSMAQCMMHTQTKADSAIIIQNSIKLIDS
ncbi:hypothetical protein MWT34_004752 [Vibrio vulnificus]|nr:hypothetical protein [Vibrio vulnificus]